MQPELREVSENEEFDFIELISGETKDLTVGKQYKILVDDGSIFTEDEKYVIDDTYTANTEFFYNPKLQLKYFKKVSE